MRRFFCWLILLVMVWPVAACMNDRDSDSLAVQAQKLPEVVNVVTGRFDRNPPLFYEMRVRRVQTELAKNPRHWALYDDIGVALSRLGRNSEALKWMAKKRATLPAFNAKDKANKEAWYRYFANAGTFHAHHWLQTRDAKNLAEMRLARDQIRRAIQIKPDAHFGREKYQLMAMEWILADPKNKKISLAQYIAEKDAWLDKEGQSVPEKREKAVEGLSGLIVLGAAWESVDVFHALASALETKNGVTLRYLALLRCRELVQNGKKSLSGLQQADIQQNLNYSDLEDWGIGINETNKPTLDNLFVTLRNDADGAYLRRLEWMVPRLNASRHPDTDAKFWNGWKPAPAPQLDVKWFSQRTGRYEGDVLRADWNELASAFSVLGGVLAFSLVMLRFLKKRRRDKNGIGGLVQ